MRLVLVALFAGGCLGGNLDQNMRPAVIPKLSELPADRGRRDAVLDSAHTTSGPEQQSLSSGARPPNARERRAVGAAATAAAVLGWIFSDTENVTLGGGMSIDENQLFVPSTPATTEDDDRRADDAAPPDDLPPADTLVPWVKLKK